MSRLQVLLDCALPRIGTPRISATVRPGEWTGSDFSSVWLDPITKTLMLLPPPVEAAWFTSNSGLYAKPAVGNYAFKTGGSWTANEVYAGAGSYFQTSDNTEWIRTAATVGKNRACFISYFTPNAGDDFIEAEFGWDNGTPGYTGDIGLRKYSGGRVEVWKGGTLVGTYTLSGNQTGQQKASMTETIVLIPFRRRDLLVVSSLGSGFVHTFDDIDESEAAPEITPDSYFWATPGDRNTQFSVQLGAITFPTSGYAASPNIKLGRAPGSGQPLESWANSPWATTTARVFADPAFQGTTNVVMAPYSGGSAFTPNGTTDEIYVRATLTGDGSYTPFVYGAHLGYAAEVVYTDSSEEVDLADWMMAASLEVPDDPAGVQFRCLLKSPQEIEDGYAALLGTVDGRAARVVLDGVTILEGVTDPPNFEDAVEDGAATMEIIIRDRIHEMRDRVFREAVPFDGLPLCESAGSSTYNSAVEFLFAGIGADSSDMDLSATGYDLPFVPGDDFSAAARVGDSYFESMDRLMQENWATALWGQKPSGTGVRFYATDPADLDPTPAITLYRDAATDVYWSYRQQPLAIEANEVRATGRSPRTGEAFQSYQVDEASQDPSLAPSAWADNHVGAERVFGILSPRLATQEACDRAVAYLFPQVSTRYWVGEWTCPFLRVGGIPLWRGDYVELEDRQTFPITSFRVEFVKVIEDYGEGDWESMPATYTGGTSLNAGGIGLNAIRSFAQMRATSKVVDRENMLTLGVQVVRTSQVAP